ncbi:hypothetical protein [Mycobacterium phage PP]|uniref:Uncharacterized protein n=1 Tax=Mycobacterium phage PP TaxID=2077134 RepID=A0A2Z5XVI8_9CAUD|nr:hypothetical protein KIW36_gp50 [Mycobacterium phage PP]BBC53841.1 hypothetical protein [Mycobacterium phage PP]
MPDRLSVILTEPRDPALPIDVQGVNLRRRAIELMQEVADVDENSVRYHGATDDATVNLGTDEKPHLVTTWQHNLLAAPFFANGDAVKEIIAPVQHINPGERQKSTVAIVRDEYN